MSKGRLGYKGVKTNLAVLIKKGQAANQTFLETSNFGKSSILKRS